MSKARAKGTKWETELAALCAQVWPTIDRAPLRGIHDRGDFTSCDDWLLEAKAVDQPRFLEWARTARKKATKHNLRWAVLWKGDRRADHGQPIVMLDLATFLELAATELNQQRQSTRGLQP